MRNWPTKLLAEVCEINPRLPRNHELVDEQPVSFVPMAAVDELSGTIVEGQSRQFKEVRKGYTYFQDGDVLFAKITPCMENGKAAIASSLIGGHGFGSTEFHVLRPGSEVMAEWVFYFIRQRSFRQQAKQNFTGTAGQQRVQTTFMSATTIPIPPLSEQRRIVDLLSRSGGIVRLRREAEKKAAELIPILFIAMFGDPAKNPKGWPIRKISEFVARFEGGKNIQAGSENGSPYRILKVSAVTSGIYQESESKPSPDGYSPPISHFVRQGDLLFSRANTEELVGATALVEATNGQTLLPDKLWRFVWAEEVEPTYVQALFQTTHIRRELGRLSSGTSASMRNISQEKLFTLALPFAPLSAQRAFAEQVRAIHSMCSQQSAAIAIAGAMFDSLLHRVFAGSHKMDRDANAWQASLSRESH